MKEYKEIVALFALGYAVTVVAGASGCARSHEGAAGFVLGHFVLLDGHGDVDLAQLSSERSCGFSLPRPRRDVPSLIGHRPFLQSRHLADKLVFWCSPDTSAR